MSRALDDSLDNSIDVCIFGATGLTGSLIVDHVYTLAKQHPAMFKTGFKWAIAGRSQERLEKLLESHADTTLARPTILIASVEKLDQVDAMTKQSRVLVNAVGPFRFLGEYVVRSCVEQKCHYVDVTGEPEFVERMQRTYHDKAVSNKVTLVHSCGFDSVPADMGVLWIKQCYEQRGWSPASIEMWVRIRTGPAGLRGNYTTYESAVHGFASADVLRCIREASLLKPLPKRPAGAVFHKGLKRDATLGYHVPFVFADPAIVRLSQQLQLTYPERVSPPSSLPTVYFAAYLLLPSWWAGLLYIVYGTVFQYLAAAPWGRSLLLRYPEFFSAGIFSRQHPTSDQLEQTSFETILRAKGTESGQDLQFAVKGPEPGYVATPRIVTQCALLLANQDTSKPIPSGVWTPSTAFERTSLLDRLRQVGIQFEEFEEQPCH